MKYGPKNPREGQFTYNMLLKNYNKNVFKIIYYLANQFEYFKVLTTLTQKKNKLERSTVFCSKHLNTCFYEEIRHPWKWNGTIGTASTVRLWTPLSLGISVVSILKYTCIHIIK